MEQHFHTKEPWLEILEIEREIENILCLLWSGHPQEEVERTRLTPNKDDG